MLLIVFCIQVYNIVNIKDSEVIQKHGEILNAMTERSREDSQLVLDLATRAQHTGRSMQTLTLLTLLYLPPSFLAVSIKITSPGLLNNFDTIS